MDGTGSGAVTTHRSHIPRCRTSLLLTLEPRYVMDDCVRSPRLLFLIRTPIRTSSFLPSPSPLYLVPCLVPSPRVLVSDSLLFYCPSRPLMTISRPFSFFFFYALLCGPSSALGGGWDEHLRRHGHRRHSTQSLLFPRPVYLCSSPLRIVGLVPALV